MRETWSTKLARMSLEFSWLRHPGISVEHLLHVTQRCEGRMSDCVHGTDQEAVNGKDREYNGFIVLRCNVLSQY